MKELYLFDKFTFYCGTDRSDKKKYFFYDSPAYFETIMENELKEKSKIVIISNSKTVLSAYSENLEASTILCITGDTPNGIKKESANPNENWSKFDLLLYNDALGPGADFSNKHFDCLFVICTCETTTPVEILQLIGRIREPIKQKVHVLVLDYGNPREYPSNSFESELNKNINKLVRFGNTANVKYRCELGQKRSRENAELGSIGFIGLDIGYSNQMGITDGRPRLVFESNEILRLSLRDKLYRDQCRSASFFKEEIQQMIRRNGGLVYCKNNIKDKKEKIKIHKTWKQWKIQENREIKSKKKAFWLADIPDKYYFQFNDFTDLHRLEFQLRLIAFFKMWVNPINFIIQDVERFFIEKEKHTKARKVYTNTCLHSVFVNGMRKFLDILGFEVCADTMNINGKYTKKTLAIKFKEINKILPVLIGEIRKSNYGGVAKYYKVEEENPFELRDAKVRKAKIAELMKCIESIFYFTGMEIEKIKLKTRIRFQMNYVAHTETSEKAINNKVLDLRKALYGIDPITNTNDSKLKCIENFLLKHCT